MSKNIDLQRELTPALRAGNLAKCERTLVKELTALPRSPFHIVLDLSITTKPKEVAAWFDKFFCKEQARFPVRAAYTEMNGFSINPDLWFFNAFAYKKYGGHEDYDWLSRWQSGNSGHLAIEGLEPLQRVFGGDAFRDDRFDDACEVTDLLVVIKFQDLIQRAGRHMRELRFPLLATAHDYDFIYEVR